MVFLIWYLLVLGADWCRIVWKDMIGSAVGFVLLFVVLLVVFQGSDWCVFSLRK